jgi:hypothetical protein
MVHCKLNIVRHFYISCYHLSLWFSREDCEGFIVERERVLVYSDHLICRVWLACWVADTDFANSILLLFLRRSKVVLNSQRTRASMKIIMYYSYTSSSYLVLVSSAFDNSTISIEIDHSALQ